MVPIYGRGRTPNKALNCTACRVLAPVQEGEPMTPLAERKKQLVTSAPPNEPQKENGYYVCNYRLRGGTKSRISRTLVSFRFGFLGLPASNSSGANHRGFGLA